MYSCGLMFPKPTHRMRSATWRLGVGVLARAITI